MSTPIVRGVVQPVGSAIADPQTIVLGPSLGTTTALWDAVVPQLSERYRVIRFDLPGHGFSPASTAPFSVADVAAAVIALVDSVGGGAFHYAGISLGGAVGLELALGYRERVLSLADICSAAKLGTADGWRDRAAQVRASGTASMVAGSAQRWFAPGFLERTPGPGSAALSALVDVDDESYALCCEALAEFDVTTRAAGIRTRSLCVSGELDQVISTIQLQELAALIPQARYESIAGAAHLPALERPVELAALLAEFVASGDPQGSPTGGDSMTGGPVAGMTTEQTYAAGMTVRRAVLGDAHVDAATAAITPETAAFQDFITRYAWGEIWARPGLDRRTRSFLTIASLVTGGHEQELAMHVRAALRNGLSRDEISEAILHTALYAGLPAANSALSAARGVFADLDAAPPGEDVPPPDAAPPTATPTAP